MTEFIIDIETDGLKPSQIWCCGVKEKGKAGFLAMTAGDLQKVINENKGATFYAHNGNNFDYPILRELWGSDFNGVRLADSLVLSRKANPKRPDGHSLKAWGKRLGFPKGDHSDWSRFTPEMGTYCIQDLLVTEKALEVIQEELLQPSVIMEERVKEIIDGQVAHGMLLNIKKCMILLSKLKDRTYELEHSVRERFIPHAKFEKEVVPKINQDGSYSRVGLGSLVAVVSGPFSRITFPEFNLGSRKQIGEYLQYFGWNPKVFTPTGQPVVDEGTLEGVDIPEAKLIDEYLMLEKRMAMVSSWVGFADSSDRVHGTVNTVGAVTFRMTHSKPNMAQVTAKGKPYGEEMRDCWGVPLGYKLVGTDADALELCMLAHYMNDPEYTLAVSKGSKEDGTDVHTKNQKNAGLPDRDTAKTFIYALLYGAGDDKIGSIAGLSRQGGRKLKERFLSATPALKSLRDRVSAASRRGFLISLDGRHVEVRSEHATLNTLLQSAGAIVMKRALIIAYDNASQEGLDFNLVGNIHDEYQCEVLEEHATRWAEIAAEAITSAGEYYHLRCPLKGTSTIGDTWAETH
jgi:DNA polymerase-1